MTSCSAGVLEPAKIVFLQKNSCSRRNFAVNLVRNIFDEDTRKLSNVGGKLGKLKMNPVLMEYVKSLIILRAVLKGEKGME